LSLSLLLSLSLPPPPLSLCPPLARCLPLSLAVLPPLSVSLLQCTHLHLHDRRQPAPTASPRIKEFTERVLLRLKPLTEGDEEIQNHVVEENDVGEQDERTQAIKLLKTVLKWLMASAGRSFSTAVPEQLQLLPLLFKIAPVENDDSYDELKRDAKTCLSLMSQGLLYTEQIPLVLLALQEVGTRMLCRW
ncbi:unnamed protein product, partial [Oncorhynchus mykiss]